MASSFAPIESLKLEDQPKLDSEITRGKRFAGKARVAASVRRVQDLNFWNDSICYQVAIVTGGAGGLGSATADRFLNDGASVAIVDLNVKGASDLINDEFKQ